MVILHWFSMTRASADIINNTQVYLFDGDGAAAGQFRQKVPDVTYAADRLTMPVAAGTWDITLVSADRDINSELVQPVRGQGRSSLKMKPFGRWKFCRLCLSCVRLILPDSRLLPVRIMSLPKQHYFHGTLHWSKS